jgi:hypothetical protein
MAREKKEKPLSTPTKPLPIEIDAENNQTCPVCKGHNLKVIDYNLAKTKGNFWFLKECLDCHNYLEMEKKI